MCLKLKSGLVRIVVKHGQYFCFFRLVDVRHLPTWLTWRIYKTSPSVLDSEGVVVFKGTFGLDLYLMYMK